MTTAYTGPSARAASCASAGWWTASSVLGLKSKATMRAFGLNGSGLIAVWRTVLVMAELHIDQIYCPN